MLIFLVNNFGNIFVETKVGCFGKTLTHEEETAKAQGEILYWQLFKVDGMPQSSLELGICILV